MRQAHRRGPACRHRRFSRTDSDPDGGLLTVTGVAVDRLRELQSSTRTERHVHPRAGLCRHCVLTYQVMDATGLSATATVVITVTPANDAPIALNDTAAAVPGCAAPD